jgi:hypothetical protein
LGKAVGRGRMGGEELSKLGMRTGRNGGRSWGRDTNCQLVATIRNTILFQTTKPATHPPTHPTRTHLHRDALYPGQREVGLVPVVPLVLLELVQVGAQQLADQDEVLLRRGVGWVVGWVRGWVGKEKPRWTVAGLRGEEGPDSSNHVITQPTNQPTGRRPPRPHLVVEKVVQPHDVVLVGRVVAVDVADWNGGVGWGGV